MSTDKEDKAEEHPTKVEEGSVLKEILKDMPDLEDVEKDDLEETKVEHNFEEAPEDEEESNLGI